MPDLLITGKKRCGAEGGIGGCKFRNLLALLRHMEI